MFRKTLFAALLLTVSGYLHGQVTIGNLPPANLPLQPADKVIVDQVISGVKSTRQANVSSFTGLSPPLTASYILQSANALIPNSRTLVGTANEILLADGGPLGNLVLSTPQPIATTSSPTFAGLTLPITALLLGNGASPISAYAGTNCVNSFPRSLNALGAATCNSVNLTLDVTNTLGAGNGGTGINNYTVGDVLTANGSTSMTQINDVSAGSYFRSGGIGVVPAWSTVKIPNAATLGDIWYGSAANTISALPGNTTSGVQFLAQTGTGVVSAAPVWTTLPGSFTGFANPTGTIGLTAVNGVATTAPRSDSAPALSQAISPTWSGTHTFQNVVTSTASGSATAGGFYSNAAQPDMAFRVSGAAADTRIWDFTANSTDFLGRALNDALSTARTWVDATRSGVAITSIALGNTTDQPTVFAHSSQLTVDTTATNFNPINVCANGQTSGSRCYAWRIGASGDLALDAADDTGVANGTHAIFDISRTSGSPTITTIAIGNPTDLPPVILNSASNTGDKLQTTGGTSTYAARFISSGGGAGTQLGVRITAGAAATDTALLVQNLAASLSFLGVSGTGAVTVPQIGTTASAANVFVDNAANNNMLRSTSSLRYKQDISTMTDQAASIIYKLRPVRFHSKASADSHTAWFYGLVAEEVAAVEPSLIVKDKEGRPDGVQYDRLQVFMLPEVQKLRKEVDFLKLQVYALWVLAAFSIGFTVIKTRRR